MLRALRALLAAAWLTAAAGLVHGSRRAEARRLPPEVVWLVLRLVPRAPRLAWSGGGRSAALLGTKRARVLRGHTDRIFSVRFLPGGDRLVTNSWIGASLVWDARSGRLLHELRHGLGEDHFVYDMDVLPGGDRIATLGSDGALQVWSAATGDVLHRLALGGDGGHSVLRALPDGDRVVTGVADVLNSREAAIWSLAANRSVHRLHQPWSFLHRLEVSECGAKIVTAGAGVIFLWSTATGRLELQLAAPTPAACPMSLAVSRGGAVVVGSFSGELLIWDGRSGHLLHTLPAGLDYAPHFALLHGGARVVAFGSSAWGTLWDVRSGERLGAFGGIGRDFDWEVQQVVPSAEGGVVAACGGFGVQRAMVWRIDTGSLLRSELWPSPRLQAGFCSIAVGPWTTMADELAE